MTQRFYVNELGALLGSYDGPEESDPFVGSGVAVAVPPDDNRQRWNFAARIWELPISEMGMDAKRAIQLLLDQAAIVRKYENGVSLASYAASTNTEWAAEAQSFIAWRDAVWAYAYEQLAFVESGQRAVPASMEVFLSELPEAPWPLG